MLGLWPWITNQGFGRRFYNLLKHSAQRLRGYAMYNRFFDAVLAHLLTGGACGSGRQNGTSQHAGAHAPRFLAVLGVAVALLVSSPILLSSKSRSEAAPAGSLPSAADLGIEFVENSNSSVVVERDGRRYLVDLTTHSIREADADVAEAASAPVSAARSQAEQSEPDGSAIFRNNCASCHGADGKGDPGLKTPDFTSPQVQASLTDRQMEDIIRHGKEGTMMPAWEGKLSDADIQTVGGFLRSLGTPGKTSNAQPGQPETRKAYTPGDDLLFSLPTGRPVPRHALIVNFTHRFPYTPAFSGPALGGSLGGLDDFSLSSFGFRFGITDKLSVSAYRSPSFIARPIQFMAAYNFLDERKGSPINAAVRLSMQGDNNFSRNYTESLEGVVSRSLGRRAQLYAVPTLSLGNRILFQPNSFFSSAIPNLPGYNTFSLGVGGALDIRPTVALVAEVIPTLVNGRPLEIHRPAYSFGIQKKIWRHSFTFGFTTSPGTTVAQRAGTRASYLGEPEADKPSGLVVGFDLSRQIF